MAARPKPVAIVGLSCSLAGGIDSPDALWGFLADGREAVGEVPSDRWAPYAGVSREQADVLRRTTGRGSYREDIAGFDAEHFGISPREARLMDPQQRLALELAWEAFEHAGIPVLGLAGTDVAVFVGVGAVDYGRRLLEDLPRIEAWTGVGGSPCGAANRISHALDLRGPSVSIDTACSSSLVAVHQAVQGLRVGEFPLALAGGVLLIAAPGFNVVLDAAGAISPDGRSKAFDAAADGYGRGEGGAFVVLKLLNEAERDGDRVLAVIRGSAVHQDGHTAGIMAPSRAAQAHLMRRAYAASGVDPASVDYVEAHGTGTPVGDVTEAGALADVVGVGRLPGKPCLIGSIKPNVGHLEAGAGVAGLIKTVLALRHGSIPATLATLGPNPAIPWRTNGLALVDELTAWPVNGHARRAGVASYGYGGTLAHVVVEEAPLVDGRRAGEAAAGPVVFPVSGATEAAALANAASLAEWLATRPAAQLADLGRTLARNRSQLAWRTAVVAESTDELIAGLRAARPVRARPVGDPVWVFSGHGAQWPGMGRGLLSGEPSFAGVIDQLEAVYREEMGFSLREAVADGQIDGVDRIQAATFALQVALASTWRSYGIRPAAVIGHSVGEIAGAVAAGVLSAVDGARLVCRRSILLRRVAGRGAMAMVPAAFAEVAARLDGDPEVTAAIAASPGTTVISGSPAGVERVADAFGAAGLVVRRIQSDVAFHSPQMEALCADFAAAVRDITYAAARVPLYTTALEDPRDPAARDAAYWVANLRQPVRFAGAVGAAAADGHRVFLELSTHPVVAHSIVETVPDAVVAHTLRRAKPERRIMLENLAALHCHGAAVDWAVLHPHGGLIDLPTNAWQRARHWVEHTVPAAGGAGHDPASQTLLGDHTTVRGATVIELWRTRLDHGSRPYPGGHAVQGTEVVPAAVLVNTLLAAAGSTALRDVSLLVPVATSPERELQVVAQDGMLLLSSFVGGDWLTHTTAIVGRDGGPPAGEVRPAGACQAPGEDGGFVVARLAGLGVPSMGFPWRIERIWRDREGLSARVTGDPAGELAHASWAVLLDAAFSASSVVFPGAPVLRMPSSLASIVLVGEAPAEALVHARISGDECVDVDITTIDGTCLGALRKLRFGRPDREPEIAGALAYEIAWKRLGPGTKAARSLERLAVVGGGAELRAALAGVGRVSEVEQTVGDLDVDAVVVAPLPGAAENPAEAAMALAKCLVDVVRRAGRARLWCVTCGAREPTDAAALAQTALWGVGRVAAGEYPERWGGLVDLPAVPRSEDYAALMGLMRGRWDEDVMAIDGGAVTTARLEPSRSGRPGAGPVCRLDGTYVITGGTGALGMRIAHWLASRGARRLVLIGRHRATSGAAQDLRRSLESAGVTVRILAGDVSDREGLAGVLDTESLGLPRIRGVVHAAGIVDNRLIHVLDQRSLYEVMRPKVLGAIALHDMFPPGSLDFFVLFSSAGQLLHLPGQAAYAAGNAFLDGLARHRRVGGHDESLSLAWTSWRGLGMSTSSAAIDAELQARGTGDITEAEALRAWDFADSARAGNLAVLRVLPGGARTPLLRDLTEEARGSAIEWAHLGAAERVALFEAEVRSAAAAALGADPDGLDMHRPLIDQGVDSLLSVAMRSMIAERLGVSLPATLLWKCPTVAAIAAHLADEGASA